MTSQCFRASSCFLAKPRPSAGICNLPTKKKICWTDNAIPEHKKVSGSIHCHNLVFVRWCSPWIKILPRQNRKCTQKQLHPQKIQLQGQCNFVHSTPQNSENPNVSSIKVSPSSTSMNIDHLTKVTERILASDMGSLNDSSILELTTSIQSWRSHSIYHSHDERAFHKTKALLYRLLDEYEYQENPTFGLGLDTINQTLYTWQSICNATAPKNITKHSLAGGRIMSRGNSEIIHEGLKIVHRLCKQATATAIADINDYQDRFNNSSKVGVETGIQHPNHRSFSVILDCYAKHGMTKEANAVFEEMLLISQNGQPQCYPDTVTYNTLMATHANAILLQSHPSDGSSSNPSSHAERAMDILEGMLDLYNTTASPDIKPDVVSFNTAIAACANAALVNPAFAQNAEDILDQMEEMYQSSLVENGGNGEWLGIRPNVICYSAVINAWANSGVPDAAERASDIFEKIQSLSDGVKFFRESNDHHDDANKTIDGMTSLMTAYGNVENGTLQQVETIFHQMIENAQEADNMDLMPTAITYTAYLDCLAQAAAHFVDGDGGEAAMKAENVVRQMEELYENGNQRAKPSTIIYNALINVWSKTRTSDSGDRAAEWLKHMENSNDIAPDTTTYSTVIDAYARRGDGRKAEQILTKLIFVGKNSDNDGMATAICRPNIFSFSSAINAYARNGRGRDAKRLLQLMTKLREEEGWVDLKPDSYCYNGVINASLKSKQKDSLYRCLDLLKDMEKDGVADATSHTAVIEGFSNVHMPLSEKRRMAKAAVGLLDRMWQLFEEGKKEMLPTAVTYNSMINLFARVHQLEKSEFYLNELERKYRETELEALRPNTVSYNTCLSAFSQAKNEGEAMRAEKIFSRMQEGDQSQYLQADSFTMTNVISAWANSGNPERAEEILNTMQDMYEQGDGKMKPTTVSFGAVLHAWARKGDILRAEGIVEHMENLMSVKGYEEMRPNSVIYNILINAYAKSKSVNSVEKAEAIHEKMKQFMREGHFDASPNMITYNTLMSTFLSRKEKGYEKARTLLMEIEEESKTNPSIRPETITFTTFLRILAKSRLPKKSVIAEEIFKRMENATDPKLRANIFAYDAVLEVCGSPASRDPQVRRHALILAVKVFTKMQDSPHAKPTSFTFNRFFTVIERLSSGEEHTKLLENTFFDCCKAGVLDDKILKVILRSASADVVEKLFNRKMPHISVADLPSEWSCNSKLRVSTKSERVKELTRHNTGRRRIKKDKRF